MSILQKLGLLPATARAEERGLLDSIEERLRALEPRRAQLVAALAGLLTRVAYADDEISDAELQRIESLIVEHTGLAPGEAHVVAAIAKEKTLRGTEQHLLTRCFNEVASAAEKRRLIECLYAVASADDLVAYVEDAEVRKIADALLLSRSEVLEIRTRYRDKLEELQLLRDLRSRAK